MSEQPNHTPSGDPRLISPPGQVVITAAYRIPTPAYGGPPPATPAHREPSTRAVDQAVTVDVGFWRSLSPDGRAHLLDRWGLPPFVMASYDRSTMTVTMRAPDTDELVDGLLAAIGEEPL